MKDPPAADYINDKISFNKELFFLLNLWAFILSKQQIPAGQFERQTRKGFQRFVQVDHNGKSVANLAFLHLILYPVGQPST